MSLTCTITILVSNSSCTLCSFVYFVAIWSLRSQRPDSHRDTTNTKRICNKFENVFNFWGDYFSGCQVQPFKTFSIAMKKQRHKVDKNLKNLAPSRIRGISNAIFILYKKHVYFTFLTLSLTPGKAGKLSAGLSK